MSGNAVLTPVCSEGTQQARTQVRTRHPLDSAARHMQITSSSSRETAHMRGTLTKPSKSRQAPSAAAPGRGRGRSRRRAACLLPGRAAQRGAQRAQRKRKRVYAKVCLWEGASDQSYWVSLACPAVQDLPGFGLCGPIHCGDADRVHVHSDSLHLGGEAAVLMVDMSSERCWACRCTQQGRTLPFMLALLFASRRTRR